MKFTATLAAVFGVAAIGAEAAKISHSTATSRLSAAGVSWTSSGGCSNRNVATCTSFDQVHDHTIAGAITLKKACNCAVTITGGTETGHASGTYSHWNGYKLDFRKTTALDSYITNTFTRIANRGDGSPQYQARSGNIYAVRSLSHLLYQNWDHLANRKKKKQNEGNHWDVTFYTDGN